MKQAIRAWHSKQLRVGLAFILLASITIIGLGGCGSGGSAGTLTPTSTPGGIPTATPEAEPPVESPTAFYSLDVSINPSGAGTVTQPGSNLAAGTEAVLTAVPAMGYTFDYWSSDASGTSESTTVTMDSNRSVTAHFTPITVWVSVRSILVSPASASIAIRQAQQFTAVATYSDGSTADVTGQATWGSYNPTAATVAAGGLAVGVSPGMVTITATIGATQGLATLIVTPS